MTYLAVCARTGNFDLVAAECKNLTGGIPDRDGIAFCQSIELINRAAFVQTGLRLIAQSSSLNSLTEAIAGSDIDSEAFRIDYRYLTNARPIRGREAVVTIADVLAGNPDLDTPLHRFMILIGDNRLYFGEVLATCEHTYATHIDKPYHVSSSLPAQLARALVNLVSPPATSILDPCCGTGTILLEAQAIGLTVHGSDNNPRMVGMSQKNLSFFGYPGIVEQTDARMGQRSAEAIVTDLPYGHYLKMDETNTRGIIERCVHLAPKAIFVAGQDLSSWLTKAGYTEIEILLVRKFNQFTRVVHLAQSSSYAANHP